VDLDILLDMVKTFGLKKIDETDKRIVLECLDLDKDGKVGFEDL
jgi:Ca2+-binding EF-hand superfamily protein